MTYDTAIDFIQPAYMDLITTTLPMRQIEDILIKILIRNGCKSDTAKRHVMRYLDN